MPNQSNYLSSGLRNFLFRTGTFSKPGSFAIAISSGTPNPTFTGTSMLEWQNANGYARYPYAPGDANWSADDYVNGYTYNTQQITIGPAVGADFGWCSGICLVDSSGYGVGNCLVWGSAITPKYFAVGDSLVIPVSGLSFQLR